MKNSNIADILKSGNITIPIYLLKNYKSMKLKLEEFIFLMYLYNLGNKVLFNPNKFSEELNIDVKGIMNYIDILSEGGFIKVESLKNDKNLVEEYVLLDEFYEKVSLLMMKDINNDKNNTDTDIYELIQKEFGRTLGTIEIEIINAWLESNISEELIKEALKEAVFNGVFNLKYIDKILYEWSKDGIETKEDVEERRKRRKKKKEKDSDIDMDIVDWNWFDEDE